MSGLQTPDEAALDGLSVLRGRRFEPACDDTTAAQESAAAAAAGADLSGLRTSDETALGNLPVLRGKPFEGITEGRIRFLYDAGAS